MFKRRQKAGHAYDTRNAPSSSLHRIVVQILEVLLGHCFNLVDIGFRPSWASSVGGTGSVRRPQAK